MQAEKWTFIKTMDRRAVNNMQVFIWANTEDEVTKFDPWHFTVIKSIILTEKILWKSIAYTLNSSSSYC